MKKRLIFVILLLILPIVFAKTVHEISSVTTQIPKENIKESAITTEHYIYGTGLIASVKDNEIKYYHKDNLGSTRVVTDSNGNKIETINYLPYGESLNSNEERFTFTGKEQDRSGLSYFGARYYDSNLGRFITVDPIKDGINYYAYANNNPLKYVDPSGTIYTLPEVVVTAQRPHWWDKAGYSLSNAAEQAVYFLSGYYMTQQYSDYMQGRQEEEARVYASLTPEQQTVKQMKDAFMCMAGGGITVVGGPAAIMRATVFKGYALKESARSVDDFVRILNRANFPEQAEHLATMHRQGRVGLGYLPFGPELQYRQRFGLLDRNVWSQEWNTIGLRNIDEISVQAGGALHEGTHALFGGGITGLTSEFNSYLATAQFNRKLGFRLSSLDLAAMKAAATGNMDEFYRAAISKGHSAQELNSIVRVGK